MKFAFDVHGVLDELEEYRSLMRNLYNTGHMIYIMSGQPLDDDMRALLKKHNIYYFHQYRSIETYLLEEDIHGYEQRPEGKFWIDAVWDPVKAQMCDDEDIDMIFDNSPSYAEAFKNVRTHYNLVIDKTKTLTHGRVNPRSCADNEIKLT